MEIICILSLQEQFYKKTTHKISERVRASLELEDIYIKGLYFIECLCAMTLSNLLKCWLCNNVNLVLVCFSRVLEQEGYGWRYFQRKKLNKTSEKVDFLKIRHFIIAEMGKASSERSTKQGTYCTRKILSCNRWTAMWLRQQQKWPVKQKKLISTPVMFNYWSDLRDACDEKWPDYQLVKAWGNRM